MLASCGASSKSKQGASDEFFQAALDGNLEVIKKDLEQFDVNSRDKDNTTALMYAAFNGHMEVAQLLLKEGADVNLVNDLNRNALMFASTSPSPAMVKLLLDAGGDFNLADSVENWTPFLFAAGEGLVENMQLLKDAGADVMAVDVDGETALDFAYTNRHQEAMVYLLQLGVPATKVNLRATTIGDIKKQQGVD